MKKRITITAVILFVIGATCLVAYQQPRFRCDRCVTQIVFLRGGFRSWGVNYCYGFDFNPDGSERHHYHRPQFFHVDMNELIKQMNQTNIVLLPFNSVTAKDMKDSK